MQPTTQAADVDVAVIGAGAVGLAVAMELARSRQVAGCRTYGLRGGGRLRGRLNELTPRQPLDATTALRSVGRSVSQA